MFQFFDQSNIMSRQSTNFLISLSFSLVSSLTIFSNVVKAEQVLLLNLKHTSDNTITREIQFYGNNIDPNSRAIGDRFSLKIDGKLVQLPTEVYERLNKLRRSFSYDSLSGGIEQFRPIASCRLGGAAKGLILEARYLTYETPAFKITSDEMRPVFSLPENCLFKDFYKPINLKSQQDARGVTEILNTLSLVENLLTDVEN